MSGKIPPDDGGHDDGGGADEEHEARLKADLALVDLLRAAGFAGELYDRFAGRLCEYGQGVLMGWLVSGEIFERCRARGFRLRPPPRALTPQDRADLITDTLMPALAAFRTDALFRGGWSASRGAALTTYFTGGIPGHFANVYRGWCREVRRQSREEARETTDLDGMQPPCDSPEKVIIQKLLAAEGLAGVDNTTACAIVLESYGYQHEEIGEVLGLTGRAVEGILYRHRRRLLRKGNPA
jgi:DNA-directed RNA polymerase specialized sigma24 family protein